MDSHELGQIEKRVQERIDVVAQRGGLIPVAEQDRLALLNEVRRLRVGLAEIAGRHDGHDHECSQRMAARLLAAG